MTNSKKIQIIIFSVVSALLLVFFIVFSIILFKGSSSIFDYGSRWIAFSFSLLMIALFKIVVGRISEIIYSKNTKKGRNLILLSCIFSIAFSLYAPIYLLCQKQIES